LLILKISIKLSASIALQKVQNGWDLRIWSVLLRVASQVVGQGDVGLKNGRCLPGVPGHCQVAVPSVMGYDGQLPVFKRQVPQIPIYKLADSKSLSSAAGCDFPAQLPRNKKISHKSST